MKTFCFNADIRGKIAFCFILFIVFIGCTTSPRPDSMSLDQAIQTASEEFLTGMPAGSRVVILNISSFSEQVSNYIITDLTTLIVRGRKISVVERERLDIIKKEIDFQFSGAVSDESVQAIGKMIGAQYVITGSLLDTGIVYRFVLNAINIETGINEFAVGLNVDKNDYQIASFLKNSSEPKKDIEEGGADTIVQNPPQPSNSLTGVWSDPNRKFIFVDNTFAVLEYDKYDDMWGFSDGWPFLFSDNTISNLNDGAIYEYEISGSVLNIHDLASGKKYSLTKEAAKEQSPFEGKWVATDYGDGGIFRIFEDIYIPYNNEHMEIEGVYYFEYDDSKMTLYDTSSVDNLIIEYRFLPNKTLRFSSPDFTFVYMKVN